MNDAIVSNEGLSLGRSPVIRMPEPGRRQATVQKKWLTQEITCEMTCYYQSQPGEKGYRYRLPAFWGKKGFFQVGEQRLCDQVRMIQTKGWLSQLQLEKIRRLVESGENNFEAQQVEQNRTGTESMQQVTEQHIAQIEEDKGRDEENAKLLINYDNIDTVEKKNILEKTVELMKNDKLPNPNNLRRIDRVRLKEKTKLVDEDINFVQTSNITEDNKFVKSVDLVITQLLGIK